MTPDPFISLRFISLLYFLPSYLCGEKISRSNPGEIAVEAPLLVTFQILP